MPTIQGTDDFNHAIDAGHYDAFFAEGANDPESVTSPVYLSQPASLLIHSEGSVSGVRKNITGSPAIAWCAFPLRFNSAPVGADVQICELRDVSGATGRVYLNSSRELYGLLSGNFGTETAPLATGVFHWVEMILDITTATHTLYFRVNDVDADSVNFVAAGGSTVNWTQLLSNSGNGTVDWYAGWWAWGSAASPTDWLGSSFLAEEKQTSFYRRTRMIGRR